MTRPATQARRLAYVLAIVGLVGLSAVWMDATARSATGAAVEAASIATTQAQGADEQIEPFLYSTAGWAVRGADANIVIDRIPERRTAEWVGGSPSTAVRTAGGPIHRTSGTANDFERARSTLPLFQLNAALLI